MKITNKQKTEQNISFFLKVILINLEYLNLCDKITFIKRDSLYIFLHRMFRGMADATIKVFIPLLILKATGNLMLSFVYLAANYFFASVLFAVLKNFIQKYVFMFNFIYNSNIGGAFLLMIEMNIWIVLVLVLLYAISDVLYYGGLNLIFATFDNKANMAKFEAGSNLGRITFYLLSAYVLENIANSTLFVVLFSLVFYAVSIVPIVFRYKKLKFLTKNIPERTNGVRTTM